MSDYEGDWEEPSRSYAAPVQTGAGVPPDPATNYIVPKGQSLREARAIANRGKAKPKRNIPPLPDNYRPALQEVLGRGRGPAIANGTINAPQQVRASVPDIQSQARDLESYKLYQSSIDNPTETVHLPQTWQWFVKHTSKSSNTKQVGFRSGQDLARDRLAEISLSTAAFIAVPESEDNAFRIWGTPKQVAQARDQLHIWLTDLGTKKQTYSKAFPKTRAMDGREEDRRHRKRIDQEQENTPSDQSGEPMAFEAYLLWPQDYDLEAFLSEYDDRMLNELRKKYTCVITATSVRPKFIRIACNEQPDLLEAYHRVMGLMKELVSQRKQGLQVTHFGLPSIDNALEFIETQKISTGTIQAFLPKMTGDPLSANEATQWSQLMSTSDKANRSATKKHLQECLNSLHIPGKHVRMRVSFGQIAFVQFKHPANGQNYSFDEFILMTRQAQTRTTLLPLQTDISASPEYTFIDHLDKELGTPDISWVVRFDFRGTAKFNGLRLEKEFEPSHIAGDQPIIKATRWLDYDDTVERFQLEHIDLEHLGWRINVGAVNFYDNERVKQGLSAFDNNVNFKPTEASIKFSPSRRCVFPPGQNELDTIYETTIAHYNLPNSRGTLEIRRIETFPQQGRGSGPKPTKVEWQAQYYFKEWDNLMAEFSALERGQDVKWSRDLGTFFPKKLDENNYRSLPASWTQFTEEIKYVQRLLTQAMQEKKSNGQTKEESDTEDEGDLDLLNSPMAQQLLKRGHK